jgi:alkanesulfonate monooxygenase SsuD/methylene tetrahydromethanopterin reductase-like flavin-dependent oxidoreductase (luciferase family)
MKLGMPITYAADFGETIANLCDFEEVGLDRVMAPEAYGFDAVTQMGYAAAMTERVELAFGIHRLKRDCDDILLDRLRSRVDARA